MMRDIFYQELRECTRAIGQIEDFAEREAGDKMLAELVETLCRLSNVARKEGLLMLEETVYGIDNMVNKEYLQFLIRLITDGTDPDKVEEIGIVKCFSANLSGYTALHYLVILKGCLALQQAENVRLVEEELLAMIPNHAAELYHEKKEEESLLQRIEEESDVHILERFYKGNIAVESGDPYYYEIKVLDSVIKSLSDQGIQRLLRETDNCDLELLMKGISGEARRRLFANLAERLAIMIANDLEFMGAVRLEDVGAAAVKIFSRTIGLINSGEIRCADEELLYLFVKIFEETDNEAARKSTKQLDGEIYKVLREYHSSSHKTINAPWGDN